MHLSTRVGVFVFCLVPLSMQAMDRSPVPTSPHTVAPFFMAIANAMRSRGFSPAADVMYSNPSFVQSLQSASSRQLDVPAESVPYILELLRQLGYGEICPTFDFPPRGASERTSSSDAPDTKMPPKGASEMASSSDVPGIKLPPKGRAERVSSKLDDLFPPRG